MFKDLAIIILAAGKGTRMKSDLAKVLHKVSDKSMVVHVVEAAAKIAPDNIHVVVGHQAGKVQKEIDQFFNVSYSVQEQLLGTGDAVKAALPGLKSNINHVLVLCGDVPLIEPATLISLLEDHVQQNAKVTVLATNVENPTGYGRIVLNEKGQLLCIREEADASETERQIKNVNTGIYCFDCTLLRTAIKQLQPTNKQAEYYLTDVIEIAQNKHEKITAVTMDDPNQVMGVNTLKDLDRAEQLVQKT